VDAPEIKGETMRRKKDSGERKKDTVAAGAAQTHSTEPIAAPSPLPRAALSPDFTEFPKAVTPPPNAMPLLKTDTREKRLYKIACMGTPLGADFFDEFPDVQEILALSLSISTRLLIVAICNSELAPTQRISAMRLVAALNGKQLAADEDEPGAKPPMPTHSLDAASAMRSIDTIRALTKMEQ
jgi:hypothetical protein